MRKTTMLLAIAAISSIFATGAVAQTRIATLDIEKIVELHPDTAHNRAILKDTLKDYQGEMEKLEAAAEAARKAALASLEESRNPALGEKARQRTEDEAKKNVEIARSAEREFAEKRSEFQRNLNEQEVRLLRMTVREIEKKVAEYAKANGIDIVLPISGARLGIAPAALWASESLDITSAIMAAMGIEEKPASATAAVDVSDDGKKGE